MRRDSVDRMFPCANWGVLIRFRGREFFPKYVGNPHIYQAPENKCFIGALVRACVCVYVCVCVCLHSSTVKVSSICKMPDTYLRGTNQRCYVVSIVQCPSAKSLHLGI